MTDRKPRGGLVRDPAVQAVPQAL